MAGLRRDLGDTRAHDSRTDYTDTIDRHGARGYSGVATVDLVRHPGLHADIRRERLLAQARGRVLDLGAEKRWMTRADLAPRSFDTIVSVFQLCGANDVFSTLLRINELLADDGRLLALEHVRATGARGRLQDALAPVWRRATGGCRANRDTIDLLRSNGFAVIDCDRFDIHGATPLVRPAVSVVAIRRVRNEVQQ
jgi:hypothetical protein